MPTTVMTRSLTAQLRAATTGSSNERRNEYLNPEEAQHQSAHPPTTPPSLRLPLGSCNGVSSSHGGHKRHQSQSPAPSGHENGNSRAVTPPHTPPKLQHNGTSASSGATAIQNGHSSPSRTPDHSPSRCPAPKSPPTPHRIKLLDEKENEKKPKKNLIQNGSFNAPPVVQQNGHKPEPAAPPVKPKLEPAKPAAQQQTKLTNFFPIRRSERRPKTEVEAKQQKTIEDRLICNNDTELGLRVQYFPEKGRGVTAARHISKGEFVVEYSGDLIDVKVAKERETKYAMDLSKGCYMYYFRANNRQYCIDATSETGRLGRLVNHSRLSPNLQTKVVFFREKPRLILVARRDIEPGEELLYDYGDRSRESLEAHPWLSL